MMDLLSPMAGITPSYRDSNPFVVIFCPAIVESYLFMLVGCIRNIYPFIFILLPLLHIVEIFTLSFLIIFLRFFSRLYVDIFYAIC